MVAYYRGRTITMSMTKGTRSYGIDGTARRFSSSVEAVSWIDRHAAVCGRPPDRPVADSGPRRPQGSEAPSRDRRQLTRPRALAMGGRPQRFGFGFERQ